MRTGSTWRLWALGAGALALAGFHWGPPLYRATAPQTALWVTYAGGAWREIPLDGGQVQRAVTVRFDQPSAATLLVADVHPMSAEDFQALAERLAHVVQEPAVRGDATTVEVRLMVEDGVHWPWRAPDYRSYTWHLGGEPLGWKLLQYGGPVVDRPAELTERYREARARSNS